jgi:hypothetical protein
VGRFRCAVSLEARHEARQCDSLAVIGLGQGLEDSVHVVNLELQHDSDCRGIHGGDVDPNAEAIQ